MPQNVSPTPAELSPEQKNSRGRKKSRREVLGALGRLSLLAALFYQFFSPLPHPPFWSLFGFGIGCGLALLLYERLLRVFS
jgi:hypothetical protein